MKTYPRTAESRILNRLRAAEGAYVTTEELVHAVWGHLPQGPPNSATNGVMVYIRRLRKAGFPIKHHERGYFFKPTLWEIADDRRIHDGDDSRRDDGEVRAAA